MQTETHRAAVESYLVRIDVGRLQLEGQLEMPGEPRGIVLFAHASGSSRHSPRNKLLAEKTGTPDLPAHHSNFLACVRGDAKELNADATAGHLAATLVHLANIAARVGRVLRFDPLKEEILGDPEAAALVRRKYREGHWAVPKGV